MSHEVPCAVCGARRPEPYLVDDGGWKVVRCGGCAHLYTSPLFDADEYAARYEASGDWVKADDHDAPSLQDDRDAAFADELAHLLPGGGRLLEVGCSKGWFLDRMAARGFDVYGIEPSRDALIARDRLGADRITHGFYETLLPGEFDAVVMFEVLEHIPEPARTAARVLEQLRPGGWYMGSVPSGAFIRAKVAPRRATGGHLRRLGVPLTMDAGNHINYFTPAGVTAMLARVGFDPEWTRNTPLELNYTANRASVPLKKAWWALARVTERATGKLVASNLWFLARNPPKSRQ